MSAPRPDRLQIVTDLWRALLPLYPPNPYQIRLWLASHNLSTVCYGVRECAAKYQKISGRMDPQYALGFALKVMNNRDQRPIGVARPQAARQTHDPVTSKGYKAINGNFRQGASQRREGVSSYCIPRIHDCAAGLLR